MSIISPPEPNRTALADPGPREAPTVADRRLIVDGLETQYLEAGTGPPVLLLHGHEQSATSWRWVIPTLARTHRVLAVSLPGHGETAPALGGYAPGRDLAPFVTQFLDNLGVGELDVVGHSVGGAVALRLALAGPERVRTLTLVASAGLGRGVNVLLALDTLPFIGEMAILLSRMPGGDVARSTMSAAMLFAQPWRVPTAFFSEQHALARRPGHLEASTAMARALFDITGQRELLLQRLPALHMPTLIIWGTGDAVLPACQAQAAVGRLPNGRLALFTDCGHLPHVEHPTRFAATLSAWLDEHRAVPAQPAHAPFPPWSIPAR